MNRRTFLVSTSSLSVPLIAGCLGGGEGEGVKDSDGDGMVDSEDYAPNDASVKEKSDVRSSEGNQPAEPEEIEQETTDPTPEETTTETTTEETTTTETTTEETTTTETTDYPSHRGTYRITGDQDFWAWEFSVSERFDLAYAVRNERPSKYDFDALLFAPDEFRDYRAKVSGDDAHPDSIDTASLEEVSTQGSRRVTLDAGTYYFVIDNTDISDAGDIGEEATRRVSVAIETRAI